MLAQLLAKVGKAMLLPLVVGMQMVALLPVKEDMLMPLVKLPFVKDMRQHLKLKQEQTSDLDFNSRYIEPMLVEYIKKLLELELSKYFVHSNCLKPVVIQCFVDNFTADFHKCLVMEFVATKPIIATADTMDNLLKLAWFMLEPFTAEVVWYLDIAEQMSSFEIEVVASS